MAPALLNVRLMTRPLYELFYRTGNLFVYLSVQMP